MRAVSCRHAVDRHAAATVLEPYCAVLGADDTARVLFRGIDRALGVQIFDDAAALNIAERSRLIVVADGTVCGAVGDGQRMPLSVEDSLEVVIGSACHACDGDIVSKHNGFTRETVVGVVVIEAVAENIPARIVVYRVGVAFLREVGCDRRFGELCRIGHIA